MCNYFSFEHMKQIILIGFSTTGKSSLIKKIKNEIPTCSRISFDTDEEISRDFNDSISNIFYQLGREKALQEIIIRENRIINELISKPDNLIIAAGPGIPMHEEFKEYLSIKKPYVILLENSPEKIYENLINRRKRLYEKVNEENLSRFGIWDIGVISDEKNQEFESERAINRIRELLQARDEFYKPIADFIFNTDFVLGSNLPVQLLDIL